MDRRKAVQRLLIGSSGLILLPWWMSGCNSKEQVIHDSSFSPSEQDLLAAIADTIIPSTSGVGALAVDVDKYLQKILDDCYEKEVQDNVKKQLTALSDQSSSHHGKSFASCNPYERRELLLAFSNGKDKQEKDFFDLLKMETIRGFNTSQKVMEEYLHYQVAPGHYYGCIPVNS